MLNSSDPSQDLDTFRENFLAIEREVQRIVVGMQDVLRLTLGAIFAGGHVLLEGAPGLGKTLLVKSIAQAMGLSFHRIQFTSDLMPSDITGTQVLNENEDGKREFVFKPGPVFSNIVLADEVNRSGPKTQSALLEAMEEKQVSILGTTHKLPAPFFVLATQNPIELEGTYPLPEAQLDRFIFKIIVQPPSASELKEILSRTTGTQTPAPNPAFDAARSAQTILAMRELVRKVVIAPPLEDLLIGTIFALTPGSGTCTESVSEYVRYGPGPRGAQSVLLAAKVCALLDNRLNLAYEDIKTVVVPALRHRLILNYQAEAEGVTADQVIDEVSQRA
jgi:MoxR-like ATPase